jgi:acyl-CoA thioester hydrolase
MQESAKAKDETLAGELTSFGHRLMARVYYADTDFSGVVYHARYLEFLERGRTDYLRLAGVHHAELAEGRFGERLVWVVRRMEIDFRRPARIDDLLAIETRSVALAGARVTLGQRILRDGDLIVEAVVEAAIVNAEGRPRRLPSEWAAFLAPGASAEPPKDSES